MLKRLQPGEKLEDFSQTVRGIRDEPSGFEAEGVSMEHPGDGERRGTLATMYPFQPSIVMASTLGEKYVFEEKKIQENTTKHREKKSAK